MNENMDVTKYDRWKYRRCIETIRKNQCLIDCDECTFDIEVWKYISIAGE